MHWVDRGPEPDALQRIRERNTVRWVNYYRDERGTKPSDSYWRTFHNQLFKAFFGICGYCEEEDKGEVDHFRPKSRFPERVYMWSNWIFSCHTCNGLKLEKWPVSGYVNPCAISHTERPECYIEFDTTTGEMVPKGGLSTARNNRAWNMIDDFHLNEFYHLKVRRKWLEVVKLTLLNSLADEEKIHQSCTVFASRESRLSSITRAWLIENDFSFDDL